MIDWTIITKEGGEVYAGRACDDLPILPKSFT
jgi:hypothetical protein